MLVVVVAVEAVAVEVVVEDILVHPYCQLKLGRRVVGGGWNSSGLIYVVIGLPWLHLTSLHSVRGKRQVSWW